MLRQIEVRKKELEFEPSDITEARYHEALDEWRESRQRIVDGLLYALRLAMQNEPLAVWELLDSCREPNAVERNLIARIGELQREAESAKSRCKKLEERMTALEAKVRK
jgi:hypothetical protein